MSLVYCENGRLHIDPEATTLELPECIDEQFLDAVFRGTPGEPEHIAEIHRFLPPNEKDRFEQACKDAGEEYTQRWAKAACDWATVGTLDGQWDLTTLMIIVKRDIHSWLMDHLYADRYGFWYAECYQSGRTVILSEAEFQVQYGETFAEHLRKIIEFLPIRLGQMIDAMEQPWVHYRLTVMRGGELVTEPRLGPHNIPPKEWILNEGDEFVSAERA